MKQLINTGLILLISVSFLCAQSYDARITLVDYNCQTKKASYSFEMRSSDFDWHFGEQNVRLFYNSSDMVLDDVLFGKDLNKEEYKIHAINSKNHLSSDDSDLSFRHDFGFLEFGISRKNHSTEGLLLKNDSWHEVAIITLDVETGDEQNGYEFVIARSSKTSNLTKAFLVTTAKQNGVLSSSRLNEAQDFLKENDKYLDVNSFCNVEKELNTSEFISVYPNPMIDNVIIDKKDLQESVDKIQLIKENGELIRQISNKASLQSSQLNILVGDLINGRYIINIYTPNNNYSYKVIKISE